MDKYCKGTLTENHFMIILMTHAMYYPQSLYLSMEHMSIITYKTDTDPSTSANETKVQVNYCGND